MKRYNFFMLVASLYFTINPISSLAAQWANWTSSTNSTVSGNIGSISVSANIDSSDFVQLNENAYETNYFTGFSDYQTTYGTDGPQSSDIIALNNASTETITFSSTVINPLIAIVSWNVNLINFSTKYHSQLITSGCGWWGCEGSSWLSDTEWQIDTAILGSNGIIKLNGAFDSITFDVPNNESWHGFTVGFETVSTVPVPSAIWFFGYSLVGFGLLNHHKTA